MTWKGITFSTSILVLFLGFNENGSGSEQKSLLFRHTGLWNNYVKDMGPVVVLHRVNLETEDNPHLFLAKIDK